ncbi:hypothetical protein MN608_10120 [Microdochium nivale]|nr:hypothetical protein MN608_10120 [Microdochium nivale]
MLQSSRAAAVDNHNNEYLDRLGEPVVGVQATGTRDGWRKAQSKDVGKLELFFSACIGSRVMLGDNICHPGASSTAPSARS